MIWIIDASVAVRWLIEGENHPHAADVLEKAAEATVVTLGVEIH